MKALLKPQYFIFILFFLLFQTTLENLYHKYIIVPVLSQAKSSLIIDICLLVFIAIIIYGEFIPKLKRSYYIKPIHLIFSMIFTGFYLYYRLSSSFTFLSFESIRSLKYLDLIILPSILAIILFINNLFRKRNNQIDAHNFIEDIEIKDIEDDLLSRSSLASNIYNQISTIQSVKSIAFGITGKWGSGKTSFMNLMKKDLQEDVRKNNFIIINYTPWLNLGINSIIQDFFDSIENEIKKHSIDISRDIRKYGKAVVNFDKTGRLENLLESWEVLKNSGLTKDFQKTNTLLKKLDKKVIVFIDDLDRLQANEIMEVLKLIRNTAGFDNFTYIVAFDKDYVVKALESINIPYAEKYPEKIFVNEIKLLPLTTEQKRIILKNMLLKSISSYKEDIEQLLDKSNHIPYSYDYKAFLTPLIHIRDIKRFINLFTINFNKIDHDIVFREYFALQILKYKYYQIYLLLFYKSSELFGTKVKYGTDNTLNRVVLQPIDKENNYVGTNFAESKLKVYLEKEYKDFDEDKIKEIGNLINVIFPKYDSLIVDLSISQSVNYFKYFKEELYETDLTKVEFDKVFNEGIENLKAKIIEYSHQGKLKKLKFFYYLKDILTLRDKKEYEKLVETAFYIGNIKPQDRYESSFKLDVLWNMTIYNGRKIAKQYYDNNIQELENFLIRMLQIKHTSMDFELDFCNHALKHYYEDNYIISQEKLQSLVISYFDDYVSKRDTLDDNFWGYLHSCKFTFYKKKDRAYYPNSQFHPEAIKIFKRLFIKDVDNFLIYYFIERQDLYKRGHATDNSLRLSSLIPDIFGSYELFEKYIKSDEFKKSLVKPALFLNEFIDFMNRIKEKDAEYKAYVPDTHFTFPPLIHRLEEISYKGN